MGVSLAEGRVACSVAGAAAGRGGVCQSRIHSGGAIDLDSFSPGGEGGGRGLRVNTSATGGRGRRGSNSYGKSRDREEEMFGGTDSSSVLKEIHYANLVV